MKRFLTSIILVLLLATQSLASGSSTDVGTTKIQITSAAAIEGSTFSVCLWIKRLGDGEFSQSSYLEKAYDSTAGWTLLDYVPYGIYWYAWFTNHAAWTWAFPTTDVWTGWCIAYDGTTTNPPIVYNSSGSTETVTEDTAPTGSYVAGTNPLIFFNTSDQTQTVNAVIANVAYYNRLVTANEAKAILRCSPKRVPNGLVGFWPLGTFGGKNLTTTAGLDGAETALTLDSSGPPISCPQGGVEW